MSDKAKNYLYLLSGIILVIGAVSQIMKYPYAFYVFVAGVAGLIVLKILNLTSTVDNFRLRRLQRIQGIGALLLLGSAYLMYIGNNAWALALILSAIFDLIIVFRTPDKKEKTE